MITHVFMSIFFAIVIIFCVEYLSEAPTSLRTLFLVNLVSNSAFTLVESYKYGQYGVYKHLVPENDASTN